MLPEAHIAFLDEVFQGSSAILNALLTLINERRYHDGSQLRQANLMTLLGSSNEIPDDPLLAAFADRFLLRYRLDYVPDDAVADLLAKGWMGERELIRLDRPADGLAADLNPRSRARESFTLEEARTLQQAAAEIGMGGVRDPLAKIIQAVRAEGITFSDRRAVKAQRVIAAHALLHDRSSATIEDLSVLAHLWNDPHDERSLRQILSSNEIPLSEDLRPVKDLADLRRDLGDLRARAGGRIDYSQEYKDLLRQLQLMIIELQRGHPGASTELNEVRVLQRSLLERAREQFDWDDDFVREG
jgi:MoxR-like ATPase